MHPDPETFQLLVVFYHAVVALLDKRLSPSRVLERMVPFLFDEETEIPCELRILHAFLPECRSPIDRGFDEQSFTLGERRLERVEEVRGHGISTAPILVIVHCLLKIALHPPGSDGKIRRALGLHAPFLDRSFYRHHSIADLSFI